MRIGFWDRVLSALSGLLIALAGAGLFVFGIGVFPIRLDVSALNGPFEWWQRVAMTAAALLLLALGVHGISLLFRRGREKGFIIQHAEYGDMSISMNALESMVKKCVASHQELTVNATRIHHSREGIVVDIKITLVNGVNIPLTVNALQKQIKQYITSCSGVDVYKVRVMVETDTAKAAASEPVPDAAAMTVAAEACAGPEPAVRHGFADRLFRHTEEPANYAVSSESLTKDGTGEAEGVSAEKADEGFAAAGGEADLVARDESVPAETAAAGQGEDGEENA